MLLFLKRHDKHRAVFFSVASVHSQIETFSLYALLYLPEKGTIL